MIDYANLPDSAKLVLFETAMKVLRQIASTPRNKGARRNANAAVRFIETQMGQRPREPK